MSWGGGGLEFFRERFDSYGGTACGDGKERKVLRDPVNEMRSTDVRGLANRALWVLRKQEIIYARERV